MLRAEAQRLHALESHKLADWPQPSEGGSDSETGEPRFGNGSVNHPPLSKFVQQTLGDLVCTIV
jgi:hypothetical protein